MDLTDIEGLTEEQQAAILERHQQDVEGLKNKNNELLGKYKDTQSGLTEAQKAAQEAQERAQAAEEERLKISGTAEELKAFYAAQLEEAEAKLKGELERTSSALRERDKAGVITDVLSHVDSRFHSAAKALLDSTINLDYNSEGKPVITFKEGDKVVSDSISGFIEHAKGSDSWKHLIKAADSSGAGANNSRQMGGAIDGKANSRLAIKERFGLES